MEDGLKNGMESLFSWEKIRSARKKGDGLPIQLSKTNIKPGKKSNRRDGSENKYAWNELTDVSRRKKRSRYH